MEPAGAGRKDTPLTKVGIIANPAASKDIRRLVAQGRVIPDWEKVNIVRRALLGLQAVGIDEVIGMPDSSHLCQRARDDSQLSLRLSLLDMPIYHTEGDTIRAAVAMEEQGVRCLITLGGDGTNRAVACGTCNLPIVPISTGTNNVFPQMVEGTLAGLAAGLVAGGMLPTDWVSIYSKTLAVFVDGEYRDMALIDVAFSRERYVATRAIWDLSTLYEVFLTRCEPAGIGLSSVGARLNVISSSDAGGLRYVIAEHGESARPEASGNNAGSDSGRQSGSSANSDAGSSLAVKGGGAARVLAPIAPGIVADVAIERWERLQEGNRVAVDRRHSSVALDGERSFTVNPGQTVEVSVQRNGPPVVQVQRALQVAAERGLFRR